MAWWRGNDERVRSATTEKIIVARATSEYVVGRRSNGGQAHRSAAIEGLQSSAPTVEKTINHRSMWCDPRGLPGLVGKAQLFVPGGSTTQGVSFDRLFPDKPSPALGVVMTSNMRH